MNTKKMKTSCRRIRPWWVSVSVLIALICCLCLAGCGGSGDQEAAKPPETKATKEAVEATEEPKATEPLATIFFTSDYQQEDGFPTPAETLGGILSAVKESGQEPEMFAFLGDYTNDRNLHDYQISPEDSIAQIKDVVRATYPAAAGGESAGGTADGSESSVDTAADGSESSVDTVADGSAGMIFVQGNHDRMTDSIAASGLHEYDEYLIYVLNTENDFPWKQGKVSGCLSKVKKASEDMKACFDRLVEKGEKRPLFIAGHVPLHFTARTSSRHTTGDNLYSSLIFDVVNEAGKSLDIVYLFGHDHSKGWDCYLGGSSVYKGPGETILIPEFDENKVNTDKFTEETLAFAYMNAGYAGYYMNCGPDEMEAGTADQYHAADETLTGSVCQIWPDRLVITRYAADGQHPLSADGVANPYKGGIDSGLIGQEHYSRQLDSPATLMRE